MWDEVGIEAMNFYGGEVTIDVAKLFQHRQLDTSRFDNLMMKNKSVAMPYEDAVVFAVNAARPLIDSLTDDERNEIDLLIVGSESGIDFGKSISNYVHPFLMLSRRCRMFETKQACFAGTAALQAAYAHIYAHPNKKAKALVITSDVARPARNTYVEPSQGAGAVAMLISRNPQIMAFDHGASGLHSFHVMDTFRPDPFIEAGDIDLSLLTYIECFEHAFDDYASKVEGCDFVDTFGLLAFHTPFPGMVKGAHRKVFRKVKQAPPTQVNEDFLQRVMPSIVWCQQVGNIYTGTVYLALASAITHASLEIETRIGIFSYGSGCSSEFYSGVISPRSQSVLAKMNIAGQLAERHQLSCEDYDAVVESISQIKFGTANVRLDPEMFPWSKLPSGSVARRLALVEIRDYERIYAWR
ncbi:putative polyketide biosynthesis protein pksG [Xenorhabdus nematophila ATCC 19061]|uniref:Polyketide biosynthesis protein pksG n=1 Tax=Xenorhabdus nematophila (strain ATCC 19061 / DSM 3370 / CCUG 14189 / LMG 1036 / NCIMB 9965 / AN6) TaxID=406817 RepID=D3VCW1_XENNA|nr:hydroxymethylglutaryl-CoA synthase [Xenorhabdus nematophila]CBJ89827.1 putative polyketide biosynthesis protein pksG [Xenorhabdus nematophila ATCC 19061]CEK22712.1 putative polyketide biosynthesis protein pksG [Xenorhabdus nematophila AN6/1]